MTVSAYYNENAPYAVQWLRGLIAAGLILAGDVDDRDISDVCADDLKGYTQCHFFAGIGLWSYALRKAGWPDAGPVWTGSCPCQPFSAAGKGGGFADQRHLWPSWFWLIEQCRPRVIFGEQVASPDGFMWFDLVSSDLEACGYTCGAVDFPSAGVGAPNIRQRLWWVADAASARHGRRQHRPGGTVRNQARGSEFERSRDAGGVADAQSGGRGEHGLLGKAPGSGQDAGQSALGDQATAGGMADADGQSPGGRGDNGPGQGVSPRERGTFERLAGLRTTGSRVGNADDTRLPHPQPHALERSGRRGEGGAAQQPSGPFDPWRQLEWIACRDGKRRPTQPGLFPLAARHPGDVAKLRAYGNAINPEVAAEIIASYLDVTGG